MSKLTMRGQKQGDQFTLHEPSEYMRRLGEHFMSYIHKLDQYYTTELEE